MAKESEDEESRYEQLAFWLESMSSESDRGIVLICGALIDNSLLEAIKKRFRKLTSGRDEEDYKQLTTSFGPLATVRAKEMFAYFMNIIGPETYSDLRAIRDIRNWFAHSVSKRTHGPGTTRPLSFKHPKVANKTLTLKTDTSLSLRPLIDPDSPFTHHAYFSWLDAREESAKRFVLVALTIADRLNSYAFLFGNVNRCEAYETKEGTAVIIHIPPYGIEELEWDNSDGKRVIFYGPENQRTVLP